MNKIHTVFFSLFTLLWFSIECLLKGIKYSSQKYLFEHIFQGQKGIRDSEYFEVDKKDYYYEVNAWSWCRNEICFFVKDKHGRGHNWSFCSAEIEIKTVKMTIILGWSEKFWARSKSCLEIGQKAKISRERSWQRPQLKF